MNDFGHGFVQGFLGTTAAHIKERKDDADEYFRNQLELARTRGLKNKDMTQQLINSKLTVAKQLQQIGVPPDLVMSIAKQNPDDLEATLDLVQKLQMEGAQLDEPFYRDIIQTSKDYKAPDEDMSTFIANLYKPVRANPEAFNDDREGGLFATMLGTNARQKAMDKLESTIVSDGMSAADLLAYSDSPTPNTVGAPTVTIDYGGVGAMERATKKALRETGPLGSDDLGRINKRFDELYEEAKKKIQTEYNRSDPNNSEATFDDIPDGETRARVAAAAKLKEEGYADQDLLQIPRIAQLYEKGDNEEEASPSVESPAPVTEPETAPIEEKDTDYMSPVLPSAPPELVTEETPAVSPGGGRLVDVRGDGVGVYQYPDGELKLYRGLSAEVKRYIRNP